MNEFVRSQHWALTDGRLFLVALENGEATWAASPKQAMSWANPALAAKLIRQVPALESDPRLYLTVVNFRCKASRYPLEWEYVDDSVLQSERAGLGQKDRDNVARHSTRRRALSRAR